MIILVLVERYCGRWAERTAFTNKDSICLFCAQSTPDSSDSHWSQWLLRNSACVIDDDLKSFRQVMQPSQTTTKRWTFQHLTQAEGCTETAPQTEKLRKVSKEKANCCFLHLDGIFLGAGSTNSELEMHTQTKDGDLGELGELGPVMRNPSSLAAMPMGVSGNVAQTSVVASSRRNCQTHRKSQKKKIHKKTCSADGSEIRLTSWYGIYRGFISFIHLRWYRISSINSSSMDLGHSSQISNKHVASPIFGPCFLQWPCSRP